MAQSNLPAPQIMGSVCSRFRRLLAMMVSANQVPLGLTGFDVRRVVLAPGVTGSPSHLFVLEAVPARLDESPGVLRRRWSDEAKARILEEALAPA